MVHSNTQSNISHVFVFCTLAELLARKDGSEILPCQPWSTRLSKMTQPNLDYFGTYMSFGRESRDIGERNK